MSEPTIRDFHAHLYYDPEQVELARQLAGAVQHRFPVAQFLALNRGTLTVFAHANTGADLADHTAHVIWFGPSETLDLSIFD